LSITISTTNAGDGRDVLRYRYREVLVKARSFLEKKSTTKAGGTISQKRKAALEEAGADCPQCGLKFRRQNHNTEHIHPKALGGGRTDKSNRIQLCKVCNNARNSVMQGFIGDAPYHVNLDENWLRIEAYLLWSELTIDEGLAAGVRIPEVHELFVEARYAGEMPSRFRPCKSFGRFSTWEVGSEPNYPHNVPMSASLSTVERAVRTESVAPSNQLRAEPEPPTKPSESLRSMIGRMARGFFDRLFDYEEYSVAAHASQSNDPTRTTGAVRSMEAVDVHGLHAQWRGQLDVWFDERDGVVSLGDFWALVADAKEQSGLAWKPFERSVGVDSRASMPVKASELLSKMGYSFVYLKSSDGYLISLSLEEE